MRVWEFRPALAGFDRGSGVDELAGVQGSRTLRARRRTHASGVEVREAHRDPSTPPLFRSSMALAMELGRSKITARIVASEPAIGVGSRYFGSVVGVGRVDSRW